MCLIIYRDTKQKLSEAFLADVYQSNPHGWGMMWRDKSENNVVKVKTGMEYEDFLANYRPLEKDRNQRVVIHFRWATHGEKTVDNCHPFKVIDDVYLMHNGVIDIEIPKKDEDKLSDTRVFVRDVLRPILKQVQDPTEFVRTSAFKHVIDSYCQQHNSRLALMDSQGPVFYGSWFKTTTNIWVSNQYAHKVDNPVWGKTKYNTKAPVMNTRDWSGKYTMPNIYRDVALPENQGWHDGFYDASHDSVYSTADAVIHNFSDYVYPAGGESEATAYRRGYYKGYNKLKLDGEPFNRYEDVDQEEFAAPEEVTNLSATYDESALYQHFESLDYDDLDTTGLLTSEDYDNVYDWLETYELSEEIIQAILDDIDCGRLYHINLPHPSLINRFGETIFPYHKSLLENKSNVSNLPGTAKSAT
jgi:hypothetical protein